MGSDNSEHWQILSGAKVVVSNSPEELWKNAVKYFEWCDTHPKVVKRTAMSGKETGKKFEVEYPRAYSVKALCLHCGILEEYVRDLRQSKDSGNEYYRVISAILYIIYTNNLEGAMVDLFNPIFTSKVLNMEKDDIPAAAITVRVINADAAGRAIPELSKSENEILEKLELEISEDQKSKEQ